MRDGCLESRLHENGSGPLASNGYAIGEFVGTTRRVTAQTVRGARQEMWLVGNHSLPGH